jgi:peptidyl-prolyl cis-trans isomerase A (cyclophilin A)
MDIPGTYLYAGEEESISISQNNPNFVREGIAFYVYGADANQGEDIYRFQNSQLLGTYIFVGGQERENIRQNFTHFIEEGPAFEVNI